MILAIDPGPQQSGFVVFNPQSKSIAMHGVRSPKRKEQLRRALAKYRATNREMLNAKQRERRKANLPLAAKRLREYRARKPEIFAVYEARRVRPPEFREKFNAWRRQWAKSNRDKLSEYAHRRSGKKVCRLPSGTLNKTGERQGWLCAACRCDLHGSGYHKDHIMPLALGGLHVPENIQLLCPPCNLKKGAKHPKEFMP